MSAGRLAGTASSKADGPYRVMVVDDSAVIRGLLSRALESDGGLQVVASVGDGQMAVNALKRHDVDVIVLDIEMPVMDGLTALPKILEIAPSTKVIVASTLTKRNADISLQCLSKGAHDYIPKPSTRELHDADGFKRELNSKVRVLGAAARRSAGPARSVRATPTAPPAATSRPSVGRTGQPRPAPVSPGAQPKSGAGTISLRAMPTGFRPDIIAIGSSTGGPQALFEVIRHLAGVRQPIVITQHMPPTFTTILGEHIERQCGLPAHEAKDGEALVGGSVVLAPGDFHMTIVRDMGVPMVRLNQDPPENFCRPACDPMLRSIVRVFGGKVLTAILTGMGHDGRAGCEKVVETGGVVVAQDEATSVVWGMPGAVATAGLCSSVRPLKELGPHLRSLATR